MNGLEHLFIQQLFLKYILYISQALSSGHTTMPGTQSPCTDEVREEEEWQRDNNKVNTIKQNNFRTVTVV